MAIISDHLFSLIGDMRAHDGKPFEGVEDLLFFPILGLINDLGLLGDVSHPLLGERGADNITGKVLHGLLLSGLNSGAAIDIEPRMAPVHEHLDEIFCDLSFGEKHLEDFVPKDLFQMFWVEPGCHPEHAFPIEAAIGTEDMGMGIESQEITKGLYGDNGPRHGIVLRHSFLEKHLQCFPTASAQVGEQPAVVKKITPENFGNAKDEVAVRNSFEHFFT
jgi:hypothetical protein